MPAQHLGRYLDSIELAAELRANGIPCGSRTPLEWSRRYPGISVKFTNHRLFPIAVARLLCEGVALADVAARLHNHDAATPPLPAEPHFDCRECGGSMQAPG